VLICVGLAGAGVAGFEGETACVGPSAATFGVAEGVKEGSGVFAARATVGGNGVEVDSSVGGMVGPSVADCDAQPLASPTKQVINVTA